MSRNSPKTKEKAMNQIESLIGLAEGHRERELSRRYVEISRRIAKRMDLTIPSYLKRRFCKSCNTPYSYGSVIRLKNGLVTVKCSSCGNIRRLPYRTNR